VGGGEEGEVEGGVAALHPLHDSGEEWGEGGEEGEGKGDRVRTTYH